jgi:hypothetical protein
MDAPVCPLAPQLRGLVLVFFHRCGVRAACSQVTEQRATPTSRTWPLFRTTPETRCLRTFKQLATPCILPKPLQQTNYAPVLDKEINKCNTDDLSDALAPRHGQWVQDFSPRFEGMQRTCFPKVVMPR